MGAMGGGRLLGWAGFGSLKAETMLASWRMSRVLAMATALAAACAELVSWMACAMRSAPSGNSVSRAIRPMPITKMDTSTSTSVTAGRRFMRDLLGGSQARRAAVLGELVRVDEIAGAVE